MENNPDRFSVIARSRKQVARLHASRARCDTPISARRSPSSRHLAPINAHSVAQQNPYLLQARRKNFVPKKNKGAVIEARTERRKGYLRHRHTLKKKGLKPFHSKPSLNLELCTLS
ncbi:hypothetical protein EVAR_88302_1 [Eumeta japonica]|uniref:Uncharacterized protein n=1 Tax=Eumeta variegata TaxID=151549 RepID=A0A4C1VME0_EUMVA|nr:hypothetical protein EVAR_88302_1 [Eumeta japonica]